VEKMATSEREALEQALQAHNYNRTATATALGLSRVGLYKKMKKYGLLNLHAH
jgi:transcriptional regulator of acetoin/glycerol metabolism